MSLSKYVRECVLHKPSYVPGEQPQTKECIKLNTNENPYPLPPEIFEGVNQELFNLNRYPEPTCSALRETASSVFDIPSECIIVGNGSDEVFSIILRTFVTPDESIAILSPSYSLYHVLASLHGASVTEVCTDSEFDIQEPVIVPEAKVIFLASPNPPAGNHLNSRFVEDTCAQAKGLVVIDEAYVEFFDFNNLHLTQKYKNVIVTRTMSKAYGLAGLRIGFGIANEYFISQMNKVRDSYNIDRLAQVIATNALKNKSCFKSIWHKMQETKTSLVNSLIQLDFEIPLSDANFILAKPKWISAADLYSSLSEMKIFVRHFDKSLVTDYVRISIGTDEEIAKLLQAITLIKEKMG
ncbi:MAG: histidinol-phosphate transaminase [Desulfobacteraceae bacterium]|nr:histidinol-phosphate transaminase [Desulfobacteraceae bacterium]